VSGKVEPGALCLVLPLPWGAASAWNNVVVRVLEELPAGEKPSAFCRWRWWECCAEDGKPRDSQVLDDGETHFACTVLVCIPEQYLMPLDPDAALKAEPDLYSVPVSKPGTSKVPISTARSN